ncbi:unnamed protein product, partial [Nesidiocoris tenuis]
MNLCTEAICFRPFSSFQLCFPTFRSQNELHSVHVLLFHSSMLFAQGKASSSLCQSSSLEAQATAYKGSTTLSPMGAAAQKMSLGSSPHRKKRLTSENEGLSAALAKNPPPIPPPLLRRLGTKEISGLGK